MKRTILLLFLFFSSVNYASNLQGVLTHVYGDAQTSGESAIIHYSLTTKDQVLALRFDPDQVSGQSLQRLMGQFVQVEVEDTKTQPLRESTVYISHITPLNNKATNGLNAAILGTKPWVSVLCKFSDVASETEALNYFQNMYANLPAGLDHYWREVSYDQVNVVGSNAFDWVTLPKTRDEYLDVDDNPDLNAMFDDCIAAADSAINFNDNGSGLPYEGINMMFNDTFGCCAWGGGRWLSLDGGSSKLWRVTWNPPWAIHTQGVIAHEMGHGFGLPHANNSDGDSNPYDSPWDVMSAASSYAVNDTVYGRLGKHINIAYKYELGWVTNTVAFIADINTSETVTVEYTAKANTVHPRFIRLPLSDGTHYTIEVRKKIGNYESNLPGNAVIIHHVDWNRNEAAWVVDADNPPANFADTEGVMWKVGETFNDSRDGYQITVVTSTTNGFEIQVVGPAALPDIIFEDNFE